MVPLRPGYTTMKTQSMFRGLVVIAVSSAACVWLISTLRSCTRQTMAGVEASTGDLFRTIRSAESALQGIFGTGVRIDSHGVVRMPRDIAELAVLEHDVSVTTRWTKARLFGWFPSTLVLTGNHRGKLGINLGEVKGDFDPETGVLNLELPPVRVLSAETIGLWQNRESCSWFTPIAPHEMLALVRRNQAEARGSLDHPEILQGAGSLLWKRLRRALEGAGVTVTTVSGPESRKSTNPQPRGRKLEPVGPASVPSTLP